MEKVHFQQEQMLPALETLHNLGLFTRPEISKIFETRSSFETKLVRRVGKKDDFLQYILYERRLDALLRTRWKRLNASNMKEKRATEEKQAVNSVRGRIFALFERAVKKFKSDLGMWFEYIKYCREVNASSRAGKVCARAMQMHPNTPAIYIFAVSGDGAKEDSDWSPYDQPSLSRTLLLRGLRLNKDSVELWVAYVLWEYGWLEVVRKRWEVLGIGASESAESSEASKGLGDVLDGAIVRTVIDQAVKELPPIKAVSFLRSLLGVFGVQTDGQTQSPVQRGIVHHILHILRQPPLGDVPEAVELWARQPWEFPETGSDLLESVGETNMKFLSMLSFSSHSPDPSPPDGMDVDDSAPATTTPEPDARLLLHYAEWIFAAIEKLADVSDEMELGDEDLVKVRWYLVLSLSRAVSESRNLPLGKPSVQSALQEVRQTVVRMLDELEHIADSGLEVNLEELRNRLIAQITQ